MEKYEVKAKTSKERHANSVLFYKEDEKIWISLYGMEERGFTIEEVQEIICKLSECISDT